MVSSAQPHACARFLMNHTAGSIYDMCRYNAAHYSCYLTTQTYGSCSATQLSVGFAMVSGASCLHLLSIGFFFIHYNSDKRPSRDFNRALLAVVWMLVRLLVVQSAVHDDVPFRGCFKRKMMSRSRHVARRSCAARLCWSLSTNTACPNATHPHPS